MCVCVCVCVCVYACVENVCKSLNKTLIYKFDKFYYVNISEKPLRKQKLKNIFLWENIKLERTLDYLH